MQLQQNLVVVALTVAVLLLAPLINAGEHASSAKSDAVAALVIGGNFTLNGKVTNLAQYNTGTHTWYTRFEPQVSRPFSS
jgi:peptidoglycan/LPS O-acetylase OafA/YrhL